MSSSANLRSLSVLPELKSSISRYAGEAKESLAAAEHEIHRTLAWLQERRNYWNNQATGRLQHFAEAKAALAQCRSAASQHGRGDCSRPESDLARAQASLREAEQALDVLQEQAHKVQQAVQLYKVQEERLKALLTDQVPRARAYLEQQSSLLSGAYVGGVTPRGPLYTGTLSDWTNWSAAGEVAETYRRDHAAAQETISNTHEQFASPQFITGTRAVLEHSPLQNMSPTAAQLTSEAISIAVIATVCGVYAVTKGRR